MIPGKGLPYEEYSAEHKLREEECIVRRGDRRRLPSPRRRSPGPSKYCDIDHPIDLAQWPQIGLEPPDLIR